MACLPLTRPAFLSFLRRDDFLPLKRWLALAWNRRTLPLFVTLKRLATDRFVFSLGMATVGSGERGKVRDRLPPSRKPGGTGGGGNSADNLESARCNVSVRRAAERRSGCDRDGPRKQAPTVAASAAAREAIAQPGPSERSRPTFASGA